MDTTLEHDKIGYEEFARAVIELDLYGDYSDKQFEFINIGSYRSAYKGPDGFVYKRNLYDRVGKKQGFNQYENATFTELRKLGKPWVPKFTLYTVELDGTEEDVMVVQFLRNPSYREVSEQHERRREIEEVVSDSGSHNLGVDPESGLIYLRDGGGGLREWTYGHKI